MILELQFYGVIVLLTVTKLLDALSTFTRIRHVIVETNPFARGLMRCLGTQRTVWIVFINEGSAAAVIQVAVANANWTSSENRITLKVSALYALLGRHA